MSDENQIDDMSDADLIALLERLKKNTDISTMK